MWNDRTRLAHKIQTTQYTSSFFMLSINSFTNDNFFLVYNTCKIYNHYLYIILKNKTNNKFISFTQILNASLYRRMIIMECTI